MAQIFCAIDTTDITKAKQLIAAVGAHVGGIKLGLEFFTHHGASGVKAVMPEGVPLFLDLKFHDIPNTVAGAVKALSPLNISLLTVHAAGGKAMLEAACNAANSLPSSPKVLAVTVLTSLSEVDMETIGVMQDTGAQAQRLATLAASAGAQGIVCSPHEIARIRKAVGAEKTLVVPGIRPEGSAKGDQVRVMTPKEAVALGADILVIGRPITEAANPAQAAQAIAQSI